MPERNAYMAMLLAAHFRSYELPIISNGTSNKFVPPERSMNSENRRPIIISRHRLNRSKALGTEFIVFKNLISRIVSRTLNRL